MRNPNYVGPDIIKESFDVLAKAVYTLQGISPIPNSEPIARTEPIVHPEYPKCVATHIWEISEGVFDFSDETENFSGTQYPTIEAAQAALKEYCAWLNHGM